MLCNTPQCIHVFAVWVLQPLPADVLLLLEGAPDAIQRGCSKRVRFSKS